MPMFRGKAIDTGRGRHPDLDQNGFLRPEVSMYADPEARDFNRQFREDPTFSYGFVERVADYQRQLPEWVQEMVQGQVFGDGEGTHAGVRAYQEEVARLQAIEDRYNHPDATTVVRDHEIADMPMERYDELFDGNGRPKSGVVVEYTNASTRLDSGVDRWSAREMNSNR